ncbi:MAG: hypothetical protein AAFO94_01690 [Bacteroidota bacterium]
MANELREELKGIAKKIKAGARDFTTLEVTTLSGEVNQILNADGKFKLKDVVKTLSNKSGTTKAKIQLVAHTHIDFDNDTINFVKKELTTDERNLFALHESAILSAQTARKSFLRFLMEILDDKI